MKEGFVYIMANEQGTVVYTGVTNDLGRRVHEHKNKIAKGFTSQYNVNKLVYYERHSTMADAIAREKQIKKGSRKKKLDLVTTLNPDWKDLYDEVFSS